MTVMLDRFSMPRRGFLQGATGVALLDADERSIAAAIEPAEAGDDAPALQKLLDEAQASGQGVVVLPAGRFSLSRGLVVPTGVSLRGQAMGATVLEYHGDGVALTWDASRHDAKEKPLRYMPVHMQDFSLIQMNGKQVGTGLWWRHAARSHLHRVEIRNFERGVDTSGASWASTISNCWILLNKYGIYVGGLDENYRFPSDPAFTVMYFSGLNGALITANEIQANEIGIYMPYFAKVDAGHFIAHGLSINNNIIEGNLRNAIIWSQHQGGLGVAENYFELNCARAAVDVGTAQLKLSDDVTTYNAVICQDLPTSSRAMVAPVFRQNYFAQHKPGVYAFYHDRGANTRYRDNGGYVNGICARQRFTDYRGFGFIYEGNQFKQPAAAISPQHKARMTER